MYQNKNRGIFDKKIPLNWPEDIKREFDKIANDFGILPEVTGSIKLRNETRQKVGELLLYKQNILDVGVGNGLMFKYLKKKVSYTGLDISAKMLTESKKRASQYSIPFHPIQGNAIDLPFKDNSFDSTICIDTLHHIPPELIYKVVDEIIRVTKKDGQILLEIKNGLNLAIRYVYWKTRKTKPLIMYPINPIAFIKYLRKKKPRVKTYFIGTGYWFAPFILFDIRT